MITKIVPRAAAVVAIVLPALAFNAYADRSEDREAIEALMWRYARALDGLNPDAYAAVFTEDGQFGVGEGATKGHEALKKMIQGFIDNRKKREEEGNPAGPMFHMTADSWVEFIDATHARHHSYWQTAFGPAKRGEPVRIAAVGRGVDHLVKVKGKWLIQIRDVAPKD